MAGKFKIMGYNKGNVTYEQIAEARTKKEALLAAESVMNKYLHTEELQKKIWEHRGQKRPGPDHRNLLGRMP